jgi:Pou domain - N-terminal to homeobox domain
MLVSACAMASAAGSPAGSGGYSSMMPGNVGRNNYNISPIPEMKYSSFISPSPHHSHQPGLNGHPYSGWMANDPSLQWSMNSGNGGGGAGVATDMYSGRPYWTANNFANPNSATSASNNSPQGQVVQHCYNGPGASAYLQQQNAQHHNGHQLAPCTSPPSLGHYVNANYGHLMHHPSESTSPNLVGCELMNNRSDGSLSSGEDQEVSLDAPSSDDLEQFAKQFKQRRIKLGKRKDLFLARKHAPSEI